MHGSLAYLLAIVASCVAVYDSDGKGHMDNSERALFAVALYLNATSLLITVFLPFQRLGVFALVVNRCAPRAGPTDDRAHRWAVDHRPIRS